MNKVIANTKYWICTINYFTAKVHTDSNNRLMKTVCNHSHLPAKEKLEVREAREKITYVKKIFSSLTFQLNFIQQNIHYIIYNSLKY